MQCRPDSTKRYELGLPKAKDSRGLAFFLLRITSCSCFTRLRSLSSMRCFSSRILRCSSTNFNCSSACQHTKHLFHKYIQTNTHNDVLCNFLGLPEINQTSACCPYNIAVYPLYHQQTINYFRNTPPPNLHKS